MAFKNNILLTKIKKAYAGYVIFSCFSLIFSCAILAPLKSQGQGDAVLSAKGLSKKARANYSIGELNHSLSYFNKLLELHPENSEYHFEMGRIYYYGSSQKEKALPYFLKSLETTVKDTIKSNYYYLGNLYQYLGEPEKAIRYYEAMKKNAKNNEEGAALVKELNTKILQSYDYKLDKDLKHIKATNLGTNINSPFKEHTPVLWEEGSLLIFSSRRIENQPIGELPAFDENEFEENIYHVRLGDTISTPQKLPLHSNFNGIGYFSKADQAFVSISHDSKQIILYKDNGLWFSTRSDSGTWSIPEMFPKPINLKNSFQPHASLSSDGNTIYFVSDRKGGFGGLDIYKCQKKSDGTWGPATNLGPEINTEMDENSPFISANGQTLYFSSKGNNSYGGYDVFSSSLTNGSWERAVNMGKPINSPADDIHFLPLKSGTEAYLASARYGGSGGVDIYHIKINNIVNDPFLAELPEPKVPEKSGPGKVSYEMFQELDEIIFKYKASELSPAAQEILLKKIHHIIKETPDKKVVQMVCSYLRNHYDLGVLESKTMIFDNNGKQVSVDELYQETQVIFGISAEKADQAISKWKGEYVY